MIFADVTIVCCSLSKLRLKNVTFVMNEKGFD